MFLRQLYIVKDALFIHYREFYYKISISLIFSSSLFNLLCISSSKNFILDMHFWILDLDIHILYMQTLGLGAQLACRDSPGWTGSRDHLIQPPTQ